MKTVKRQGFASLDPIVQKEIARKGGLKLSANRAHMAEIGRRGGLASHRSRLDKEVLL